MPSYSQTKVEYQSKRLASRAFIDDLTRTIDAGSGYTIALSFNDDLEPVYRLTGQHVDVNRIPIPVLRKFALIGTRIDAWTSGQSASLPNARSLEAEDN